MPIKLFEKIDRDLFSYFDRLCNNFQHGKQHTSRHCNSTSHCITAVHYTLLLFTIYCTCRFSTLANSSDSVVQPDQCLKLSITCSTFRLSAGNRPTPSRWFWPFYVRTVIFVWACSLFSHFLPIQTELQRPMPTNTISSAIAGLKPFPCVSCFHVSSL